MTTIGEGYLLTDPSSIQFSSVAQSCLTLCTSMDYSLPGSLSMGFSRQEYWSGLLFPTPRDLPDQGIEPMDTAALALADRFFIIELPGVSYK